MAAREGIIIIFCPVSVIARKSARTDAVIFLLHKAKDCFAVLAMTRIFYHTLSLFRKRQGILFSSCGEK